MELHVTLLTKTNGRKLIKSELQSNIEKICQNFKE